MSFSSETKDALAREPLEPKCCMHAELVAFIHLAGSVDILGNDRRSLMINTESQCIARRVYNLIKELYGIGSRLMISENKKLNKLHTFHISVTDTEAADRILLDAGVLRKDGGYANLDISFKERLTETECCRKAFLRAAFLAAGSVCNPEKFYHLEFTVENASFAGGFLKLLEQLNLNAKITSRKGHTVIYLKGADQVSELLAHMHAFEAMLKLENIRVLKDVRNNVNRAVNCENANVDKTINAATRQIESIQYISDNLGLDKLPEHLRRAAELRLSNPYAPLSELCSMVSDEVGKSGLNHRLKKLEKIAQDLRSEKGEI
ncbi:MAG TPA: DNA-binding protein WhiA [Clostridia bacterium]|nr:DNA-binding protein WhiA [Clostridia bacterium]